MSILDTILDTFRSPDPKRVKERIVIQIQDYQATKAELQEQRRKLQLAILNLNRRLMHLRKNNPSLLAEIRSVSRQKTDVEYQDLEVKTAIEKLDREIAQLTARYRQVAA
ncbi:hypothetical protein HZC31_00985 [Candidatus Woesearchaeota archaeon]|nr:hypothetical protein [Candidatus Woesearchaeota archaeon]